ncbi:MAG: hypothetical protein J6X56_01930 [Ruminococcus sp.]|uniref:hypothetical protein n=1 Tax=Ruminococcus sp. TaxID=41978 RepID=UPI001B41FDFC|nr:hypothetical protein [Ruminococcus sp.]MBP5578233.1 hypothetical protein [Ruminococcus sp.]
METSHLILEAICLSNQKEETNKCNCKGKQIISIECLRDNQKNFSPCCFLGISKAKSTIALTDEKGIVINGNEFFGGFKTSVKEYAEKERQWIDKCDKLIDDLKKNE